MNKLTKPKKQPLPDDDEYLTAPTRRLTVKGGHVVSRSDLSGSSLALPSKKTGASRPSSPARSGSPVSAPYNDRAPSSCYSQIPSDGADVVLNNGSVNFTAEELVDLERNLAEDDNEHTKAISATEMMLTLALLINNLSLLVTEASYFPTDTTFDVLQNELLLKDDQRSIDRMNHNTAKIIDRLKDERLWQTFVALKRHQGQMDPLKRIIVDVKEVMDGVHALFAQRFTDGDAAQ